MVQPAFYFEPDGYSLSSQMLMGRQMASHGHDVAARQEGGQKTELEDWAEPPTAECATLEAGIIAFEPSSFFSRGHCAANRRP